MFRPALELWMNDLLGRSEVQDASSAALKFAVDGFARLNAADGESLESVVRHVLDDIGRVLGLDRIVFAHIDVPGKLLNPEISWDRDPETAPHHLFMKSVDRELATRLGLFGAGDPLVCVSDLAALPLDHPLRRAGYRLSGALLVATASADDGVRSLISFAQFAGARRWSETERLVAQLLVEGVAGARERVQALRDADRQRHRIRDFMQHSDIAVWCWAFDPPVNLDVPVEEAIQHIVDAPFVEANQAFCDLRGHASPAEVLGSTWRELYGREPAAVAAYTEWLRERLWLDSYVYESHRDQSTIVKVEIYRERTQDGRVRHIWGSMTDVTELEQARRELEAKEARLQDWVDHTEHLLVCLELAEPVDPAAGRDAVFVAMATGSIVDCTDSYAQLHGQASREALIGQPVSKMPSRFGPKSVGQLLHGFADNGYREATGVLERLDPSHPDRYYRARFQGAFDDPGRLVRIWNALADVTESFTAEKLLKEARDRNQQHMRATRERVICVEFDEPLDAGLGDAAIDEALRRSTIVEISESSARVFGVAGRHEAIGQPLGRFAPTLHPELRRALLDQVRDPHGPAVDLTLDYDEFDPANPSRVQSAVVESIREHDGVRQFWVRMRDITEEHEARLALIESERLRTLAMASAQLYLVQFEVAPDQRIIVQPEGLAALGIPGRGPASLPELVHLVHEDDRGDALRALDDFARRPERPLHLNVRLALPDRDPIWLELWAIRADSETTGPLHRAVGVFRDVTETRLLERRMLNSQKLESLGVLAGGIAHDFNNLLMAMLGHAQLAAEIAPAEVQRALGEIEQAARRAAELCAQLLAYAGGATPRKRDLDLVGLVEDMAGLLEVSIRGECSLERAHRHPQLGVHVDEAQLTQVVMNLIVNASDALEGRVGRIRLETDVVALTEAADAAGLHAPLRSGDYARLQVIDDGCGMSDAVMERIFDPFYSTKFAGRGLGMAAVLGIVQAHEGGISVRSEEGEGSCISVLLPLVALPRDAEVPGDRPVRESRQGLVLVVDDERTVREVSREMLRHLGYQVLSAAEGEEGLRLYRKYAAQLQFVLVDLTMPGIDGVRLVRAMRAMTDVPCGARFVITSGFGPEVVPDDLHGAGVGFLQKPYNLGSIERVFAGETIPDEP